MTTRPRLKLGSHLVPGLAAVALFAVMVAAFVTSTFPDPQGFGSDANITASIGYAMFNLDFGDVTSESFLVAFIVIAVTLDVALDGAVYLAKRGAEAGDTKLRADGGRVRSVGKALGVGGETEATETDAATESEPERPTEDDD